MNKAIWISSFPKSGNTWVRLFLSNYFYNNSNLFSMDASGFIPKFPILSLIKEVENKKNQKLSLNNISEFWRESHNIINKLKGDTIFLKNHNAYLKINEINFTNENFTKAIIYIVRDPRDVIVSYAKWNQISYDDCIVKCIDSNFSNLFYVQDPKDKSNIEIIGSWKINYLSWKNALPNTPKLIIKYEDLLRNSKKEFRDILNFLSKIMKFNIDEHKFQFCLENTNFNNLKTNANKYGFHEGADIPFNFFRKGTSNQWKTELNLNQIKVIEKSLKKEMIELNYL